jgi:hypothetical protein
MSKDDFVDVYRRYLGRFEEMFGDLDFEQVVQHRGKLVKKLRYDEFVDKWSEYKKIEEYLREVMTKGATLNDEINRNYEELSAYVLQSPKDFVTM